MYALAGNENICNDKWLASLVDAMDEVEAARADDICRAGGVPAGLLAQLDGRDFAAASATAPRFELA